MSYDSLAYQAGYPYPVPPYMRGGSVVGEYQPALGPFPALTAAGYGLPGGLVPGSLANVPLATTRGGVVLSDLIVNDPAKLWYFRNPSVVPISVDEAQKLAAQAPRSKSRIHSSTYGSLSADASGHAMYGGMGREVPSYGHYRRS
jgi:hypothetical protein